MMFGRRIGPDESYPIIDKAIDAGINFLDTANVYGRGKSETIVGQALKRNGKRAQIVLATKVHGRMTDGDPNAWGSSRRHIIEQCEASLRRLQTDYIDLYQIHRPRPEIAIDETLRALDDLIRAGKVRYIGTSTFAAWQVVESLWASKELGLNRFVCEQPPYNLLDRRAERELLPMAQTFGLGIIPWSPLGGGLLSGKYRRGAPPPADSRIAVEKDPWLDERLNAALDTLEALQPLVDAKGCTMSQYALAWCLNQPGVTSPIIGPRSVEQLMDNLGALDVKIADEEQKRIDEIVPRGRMVSSFYEADFGPHPYRW
jgi:aryl-alcohol dehydrogenase-like predicted oxidoreductase